MNVLYNLDTWHLSIYGLTIITILAIVYKYFSPLITYVVYASIVLIASKGFLPEGYDTEKIIVFFAKSLGFLPPNLLPLLVFMGTPCIYIAERRVSVVIEEIKEYKKNREDILFLFRLNITILLLGSGLFTIIIFRKIYAKIPLENEILITLIASVIAWYVFGNILGKFKYSSNLRRMKSYFENLSTKKFKLLIDNHITIQHIIDRAEEEISQGKIDGYFMKGSALYIQGKYNDAISVYNTLIEIFSGKTLLDGEKKFYESAYLKIGEIYMYQGNYDIALSVFEKAKKLFDSNSNKDNCLDTRIENAKLFIKPKYNLYTIIHAHYYKIGES